MRIFKDYAVGFTEDSQKYYRELMAVKNFYNSLFISDEKPISLNPFNRSPEAQDTKGVILRHQRVRCGLQG